MFLLKPRIGIVICALVLLFSFTLGQDDYEDQYDDEYDDQFEDDYNATDNYEGEYDDYYSYNYKSTDTNDVIENNEAKDDINGNSEQENSTDYEDRVGDTSKERNLEAAESAHEVNSNSIDDNDYKTGDDESEVEEGREEDKVETDGLHNDYKDEEIEDAITDNTVTNIDNNVVDNDETDSYDSNKIEKEDTNNVVHKDEEANNDTADTIEDSASTQYKEDYGEDNYDDAGDYDDEENYEDQENYDQDEKVVVVDPKEESNYVAETDNGNNTGQDNTEENKENQDSVDYRENTENTDYRENTENTDYRENTENTDYRENTENTDYRENTENTDAKENKKETEETKQEEQKQAEEYYEYEDDDMDTLYRNYEILSEFYQKYFVDLRVLDESCEPTTYPAPSINNGRVVSYLVVDNVLLPKKRYRQAVYDCNRGYALSTRTSNSMFCQEFTWTGLEPDCEKSAEDDRYGYDDANTNSQTQGSGTGEDCGPDSGCSQECRIENGYPTCFCSDGFVEVQNGECSDINECNQDNGGCEEECENKPGSYICSCPSGYELSDDSHTCVDTNECLANNGHGPCQDTCINVDGYYYCECNDIPGTELNQDRHTCTVVNLCEERNGGCSHYCHSTHGQSYCSCPSGYELSEDFKTCKDVNECNTVQDVCSEGCENEEGTYRCVDYPQQIRCPEYHKVQDGECVPDCGPDEEMVDGKCLVECEHSQQMRDDDGACMPLCTDGKRARSDGQCVPACYPGVCGDQGQCQDGYDGYSCSCDPGYTFSSGTCLDKDECVESSELCRPYGQCTNTIGSYFCHCMPGYRNEDGNCVDIDECSGNVVCAQKCINTVGSYHCECWEGYSLAAPGANTCVDIDECSLRPAICEQDCRNLAGSFSCVCQNGFTTDPYDDTKCLHVSNSVTTCPRLDAPAGGKLACTGPESGAVPAGTQCTLTCKKGFIRQGNSQRSCMDTGDWDNGVGWCQESSCVELPPVQHATVTPQDCLTDRQQFKSRCKVSCHPGYSLQGSSTVICGRRSRWIQRRGPPSCVAIPGYINPDQDLSTRLPDPSTRLPDPSTRLPDPQNVSPAPPESNGLPTAPDSSTFDENASTSTNLVSTTTSESTSTTVEPRPQPYIICPSDILVNLTEQSPVQITIPPPKTNMDWKDVETDPTWGKELRFSVVPGTMNIQFQVEDPVSRQVVRCKMSIRTVDTKPPDVKNCPNSFTVYLDPGEKTKVIEWQEPIFSDNVGVTSVLASQLPGQQLGKGRHVVIYQALDAEGNRERCVFSIRVANLAPQVIVQPKRIWVLCRVGNTGRQIRLLVSKVPTGCRRIKIRN